MIKKSLNSQDFSISHTSFLEIANCGIIGGRRKETSVWSVKAQLYNLYSYDISVVFKENRDFERSLGVEKSIKYNKIVDDFFVSLDEIGDVRKSGILYYRKNHCQNKI